MPNKAYNYDFKMYLEGVEARFKSAMITCTPNGVEANINLLSNKQVYQLKPKTSVQIFYKDWVDVSTKHDKIKGKGWRLMFDGYLSGYFKVDESLEGRGLGIICRDFRMDIRRAPAAMAWQEANSLGNQDMYHQTGLYHTIIDRGLQKGIGRERKNDNIKQPPIRTYDLSGLSDLGFMVNRIANTAYGKNASIPRKKDNSGGTENQVQKNGSPGYREYQAAVLDNQKRAKGAFFLDAVVRGMWSEAVGGTAVSTFINKRTRIDKRFMIPRNAAGYNFWFRNQFGLEVGSTVMGNSMFSSLEAAIMRIAGLFSVRVYSCSTPSLINLDDDNSSWIIDDNVKDFLVKQQSKYFGAPYALNESMLLPPLEFTAPPNCNIILPPMYDRIQWQYDTDADITRAYFKQIDTLSTQGAQDSLESQNVQIPNALFNNAKRTGEQGQVFKRIKPPLTLEERYKGVNIHQGSVELVLAQDDAAKAWADVFFSIEATERINSKISDINDRINKAKKNGKGNTASLNANLSTLQKKAVKQQEKIAKQRAELKKIRNAEGNQKKTKSALDRHALIKFLNSKYSGRVATVDMQFNPYIMCGFPGAVLADDEAYGDESMKSVIGTVQVVKHSIAISPSGGDARTAITLNNSRYIDEPTDMDDDGNPLYSPATVPEAAKIDENLNYENQEYTVQSARPLVSRDLNNDYYDLDEVVEDIENSEYKYAKDFLSVAAKKKKEGDRNRIYLDDEYAPNRIAKFYTDVFKHKTRHFMIGSSSVENSETGRDENINFMYDTIHEALDAIKINRSSLMNNYEECVKFIARDVCSADAYFQGILGLSIYTDKNQDGSSDSEGLKYRTFLKDYDQTRIFERYYGTTTALWESGEIDGLKNETISGGNAKKTRGLMTKPGQFSSIREHMPITAFIQERRDAAERYVKEANKRVQGIRYANNV